MGRAEPEPGTLFVDADGMAADCGAIDVLARLTLIAQRQQLTVKLRNASPELCGLIELTGLSEVLLRPRSTGPRC